MDDYKDADRADVDALRRRIDRLTDALLDAAAYRNAPAMDFGAFRALSEANERNANLDRANENLLQKLNATAAQLARANADLEAVSLKLVESESRNERLVQVLRGFGFRFENDRFDVPAIAEVAAANGAVTLTGGVRVALLLVVEDSPNATPFVVIGAQASVCTAHARALGATRILTSKVMTLRMDGDANDESE